jgi:hypothetical protein
MNDEELKNIAWGSYYKLTEDDKKHIRNYFEESTMEEMLSFCEALAMVASFSTWHNARAYLKEVGYDNFFRNCSNCDKCTKCDYNYSRECGTRYKHWVLITEKTKEEIKLGKKD